MLNKILHPEMCAHCCATCAHKSN